MGMLRSVEGLRNFSIAATDGELGHIKDVLFDDGEWAIRHLVVDTGGWLTGRKVLVSPLAVTAMDWSRKAVRINLTQEQIRNSPDIDTAMPVSRQQETDLYNYYGYPEYWTGPYLWGYTVLPNSLEEAAANEDAEQIRVRENREHERAQRDPHLRSAGEVDGYAVHASDGAIGHVEDFLFDEENWKIGMIVIDTRNWWPGKQVMISPHRIAEISWDTRMVMVNATRDAVENSPQYDPSRPPIPDGTHDLFRQSRGQ